MTALSALFIGGTGVISSACSQRAIAAGIDLTILNRGTSISRPVPENAEIIHCDIREPEVVRRLLGSRCFDVIVDFVAFLPEHVESDINLFRGRTSQYVFVSSAAVYQTPPRRLPIVESTPLYNPQWQYSRAKIACEILLMESYRTDDFPATIVRPGQTYDRTSVPLLGGWTVIDRMRRGLPIVVHGDGSSLRTLTHSDDFANGFVGLLGNPQSVGDSFHITSDEVLTWNQIYEMMASAAGTAARLAYIPSERIAARSAELGPRLLADRAHSVIFDNSKIKALVRGYTATIPFAKGAREIIDWHDASQERRVIDHDINLTFDELLAASSSGPDHAA